MTNAIRSKGLTRFSFFYGPIIFMAAPYIFFENFDVISLLFNDFGWSSRYKIIPLENQGYYIIYRLEIDLVFR